MTRRRLTNVPEILELFDRAVAQASKADRQALIAWPRVGQIIRLSFERMLRGTVANVRASPSKLARSELPTLILIGGEGVDVEACQIEYPEGTLSQTFTFNLFEGRHRVGDVMLFFVAPERLGNWHTVNQVAQALDQMPWKINSRLLSLARRIPVFEKHRKKNGRVVYRLAVKQVSWQPRDE